MPLAQLRARRALLVAIATSGLACVGDSANSPSASDAGGTDGSVPTPEGGADAGGDAAVTHAVGGVVHFLQAGGAVKLANGPDTVIVTDTNPFTFPARVADGASYTVAVVTSPVGQRCSVRANGTGTATADVSVTVSCTLAVSGGSLNKNGETTSSTSFTPIQGIKPITFTTDIASNVLVALNIGAVQGDNILNSKVGATIGIDVDNKQQVAQGHHAIAYYQLSHSFATFEVVPVSAGTHTFTPVWKADTGMTTSAIAHSYGSNFSAVVLESLKSFAGAQSSTATVSQIVSSNTPGPLSGLSDVGIKAPSGTLLGLLKVPSATGTGIGGAFQVSIGGTSVASAATQNCGVFDFTYPPAVLSPVVAGQQTVSAQWMAVGASTFQLSSAQVRMDAVAFDASAGGKISNTVSDVSVASLVPAQIPSLPPVTLNPLADSQALVILQSAAAYTEGNGAPGVISLDLDGTVIGNAFVQSQNGNCARPATVYAVVPVTTGARVLTGKMAELPNMPPAPIHVSRSTSLSAILLE